MLFCSAVPQAHAASSLALSFDGENDLVSIADANDLDLTTDLTLEVWVYPTEDLQGWRSVLLKGQSVDLVYAIYANSDAAGNLMSDGSSTYAYDALGRVTALNGTSNGYNGDGVLVAQTSGSTTTSYAQDLAAPLSQILSDGTNRYIYGNGAERLFGVAGSTRTWYSTDALGTVRATLDDTGSVLGTANYDPWGVPETGAIAPFGFTGELQQGSSVYLRARWYGVEYGRFFTQDRYMGNVNAPRSLLKYPYAYNNPVRYTDASGFTPDENGVMSGEFTYSCNCGWIDWKHTSPSDFNPAKRVIEAVEEALTFFSNPSNSAQYYVIPPYKIDHQTHGLQTTFSSIALLRGKVNESNKLQVAMGIFRWVEENIENYQWPTALAGPNSSSNSYFAEEDLSSDLISFYGYTNRYTQDGEAFRTFVRAYCRFPSNSKKSVEWSTEVYKTYGGFTSVQEWENPILKSTDCIDKFCGKSYPRAWPNKFKSIQPIQSGVGVYDAFGTISVRPEYQDKPWIVLIGPRNGPILDPTNRVGLWNC